MPKTSLLSYVLMWVFWGIFFFGLLNTKSTKLGINLDNTKFKHIFMETSHIHIDQRHM